MAMVALVFLLSFASSPNGNASILGVDLPIASLRVVRWFAYAYFLVAFWAHVRSDRAFAVQSREHDLEAVRVQLRSNWHDEHKAESAGLENRRLDHALLLQEKGKTMQEQLDGVILRGGQTASDLAEKIKDREIKLNQASARLNMKMRAVGTGNNLDPTVTVSMISRKSYWLRMTLDAILPLSIAFLLPVSLYIWDHLA